MSVLKETRETPGRAVCSLEMDRIRPNPGQPRKEFGEMALLELASSIRQHGLLQPITVRETEALVMRMQKRLPVPPPERKVISLARDPRLYVNAVKSVVRQMQDTGMNAVLEIREDGEWTEMKIRIKKSLIPPGRKTAP